MPDTIDGWYKQAMHLDRQWRQAKYEVEYYSQMTNTARMTQPQNNVGQYDTKPVVTDLWCPPHPLSEVIRDLVYVSTIIY